MLKEKDRGGVTLKPKKCGKKCPQHRTGICILEEGHAGKHQCINGHEFD